MLKIVQIFWWYCNNYKNYFLSPVGCKFNNYEYKSITEVIADIRLILENCYRYNGANHWVSKLGHKMEKILEQKLALLNRYIQQISFKITFAFIYVIVKIVR